MLQTTRASHRRVWPVPRFILIITLENKILSNELRSTEKRGAKRRFSEWDIYVNFFCLVFLFVHFNPPVFALIPLGTVSKRSEERQTKNTTDHPG